MPGAICTSSHPSAPKLSRICFAACVRIGAVRYSHLVMGRTLPTASERPLTSSALEFLGSYAVTLTAPPEQAQPRLLSPAYAATTVGMFALCAFVAFEATAITTVMPTVEAQLEGVELYALSFTAPLASGVVGMVVAGGWSDRRGPIVPLAAALVLFASVLVVCGLAPSMEVLVAGRILQGLGGGALTVCLYVLVGLIFPAALQPAIFTSFAAAWVLPTLFGPALAAYVAHVAGWRWVFLGVVVMVAAA